MALRQLRPRPLDIEDATLIVARRKARPGDGVRYAAVGDLTREGFHVRRDSVFPANPDHVLVQYSEEWTEDIEVKFERCFGEPLFKESQHG